jgi:mycothiol synthase
MRTLSIKRSMGSGDIAGVQALLDAAQRADGNRPLADHLWLDLVHGGRAGFAGLVAWEPGHDHPVAYAQVSRGNDSWALELVIDPHHRYEALTIGPELLGAALDVVRGEGGGHVHWWVFEPTNAHHEIARVVGLAPGRSLLQMRRPLPLPGPTAAPGPGDRHDFETRAFVPGQDDARWLAVNNRAFVDHPEQGGWDLATLSARQAEAWFDPAGFLLHEIDGRLAAFCWTKVHHDSDPVLGEIYAIAVDPDFAGRGLGRALTVAGLDSLAARGVPVGMLYVDAENTAAVNLYHSLGFDVHHSDGAFVGDI